MIKSDWHIHSKYSYDACNKLEVVAENAKEFGLKWVGITDHLNYNDKSFIGDLTASANAVKEAQEKYPYMVLGVELTTVPLPELQYCAKTGTREGYVEPITDKPYEVGLALSKEELKKFGVRYAVAAAHWDLSVPVAQRKGQSIDNVIKDWHRQQMWLAVDERTTILAHPWWNVRWFEDFSVISRSMNEELACALKQNGKYVECNSCFFTERKKGTSEKFRNQYAEFLRELFEKGLKITYGSDSHGNYSNEKIIVEEYLKKAGFKAGDISDLTEKDFW